MKIEIIKGISGLSIYVDDFRICGSKPYGGGITIKTWNITDYKLVKIQNNDKISG